MLQLKAMELRRCLGLDAACDPAVHPGRGFVAHAAGHHVVLWDWRRDARQLLAGHEQSITSLAFTPDGLFLAASGRGVSSKATVLVWDLSGARSGGHYALIARYVHHAQTALCASLRLCFSNDGDLLVGVETSVPCAGCPYAVPALNLWDWSRHFKLLQVQWGVGRGGPGRWWG